MLDTLKETFLFPASLKPSKICVKQLSFSTSYVRRNWHSEVLVGFPSISQPLMRGKYFNRVSTATMSLSLKYLLKVWAIILNFIYKLSKLNDKTLTWAFKHKNQVSKTETVWGWENHYKYELLAG